MKYLCKFSMTRIFITLFILYKFSTYVGIQSAIKLYHSKQNRFEYVDFLVEKYKKLFSRQYSVKPRTGWIVGGFVVCW